MTYLLIGVGVFAVVVLTLFISLVSRYKKCPSDKILVVYGKVGKDKTAKCIHGGAAFVWPVIQDYSFLELTPIQIEIPLTGALSKQQIRVSIPSTFTIAISTEPNVMPHAAERLLGVDRKQINTIASEIIFGQLRQVVATMTIEEINADREKFLSSVSSNVETELEKIGLRLINVNVTDIRDESGYIDSLGKNAAAEALNKAKKDVAEKDRDGEIGKAVAEQDKRVKVAEANSIAVQGENEAKITIANSESALRQKKAEADKLATASEKVQQAKALEEAYKSEQIAEQARAEKEYATQQANDIVKAKIDKEKITIAAEADAEKSRIEAKGRADAIFAEMEAKARGIKEILDKQAEGYKNLVAAAGDDPSKAAMLLIVDKLPELVKTQVEAIKGIKIDKITVWDSGSNKEGASSTSNFISSLMSSVPPLQTLFNQAGLNLPDFLGSEKKDPVVKVEEVKK